MERARTADAVGLIATPDWSFSFGRDWGSPHIPEKMTPGYGGMAARMASAYHQ